MDVVDGVRQDNLTVPQGSYWQRSWPVRDTHGDPIDTTGWTLRGQIRLAAGQPVLHEWSTDRATPNATTTGGWASVTLAPEDTDGWDFYRAVYDLVLTDPAGHAQRIVQGAITVSPAVTR